MKNEPKWLKPMLEKRSAKAIQILAQLLEAGIRRGECSANDITVELTKEEHNVVGACFTKLRSCGFYQDDRRIAPRKADSHGRRVFVWVLRDHTKAREVLARMSGVLVSLPTKSNQLELI